MKYLVLLITFFSVSSFGASLSKYRVYLDDEQRNVGFMIVADKQYDQECDVSFDYIAYEEGSIIKSVSEEKRLAMIDEARSKFRFSPKKFTLKRGSHQNIKFIKKRGLKRVDEEHRAYLTLKCSNLTNKQSKGLISLTPRLVHKVPLIIRSGKPKAELEFKDINLNKGKLAFTLDLKGQRSVFGSLTVLDEDGEVLDVQRNVVIYPEAKYRTFQFNLAARNKGAARIVFEERSVDGGDLKVIHNVQGAS